MAYRGQPLGREATAGILAGADGRVGAGSWCGGEYVLNRRERIGGYVYVHFIGRVTSDKKPLVNEAFTTPYNPYDWMASYDCIKPRSKKSGG